MVRGPWFENDRAHGTGEGGRLLYFCGLGAGGPTIDAKAYQLWRENLYRPRRRCTSAGGSPPPRASPVEPVYGPWDAAGAAEANSLPGEFPSRAGISAEGYRGRYWTMRQYAGFGSAARVQRPLPVPARAGPDGPVGRLRPADADGLRLGRPAGPRRGRQGRRRDRDDRRHARPDRGAPARPRLDLDDDQRHGVDPDRALPRRRPGAGNRVGGLSGTVQNDLLKEYIARGTYIFPPRAPRCDHDRPLRLLRPRGPPLEHDLDLRVPHPRGGLDRGPGSRLHALQRHRVRRGGARAGLAIDDFAPRLSFFFNAHANFFEEVAKFRAARALWAEIARDRFGAKDPKSWRLRFHTQTAGSTLTAQQPDVNVVRVALQALSAVLGGTQSLHTNAKDEALALPTEESARLALRTQQVIANETRRRRRGRPPRRLLPRRGLDGGDPRPGARAASRRWMPSAAPSPRSSRGSSSGRSRRRPTRAQREIEEGDAGRGRCQRPARGKRDPDADSDGRIRRSRPEQVERLRSGRPATMPGAQAALERIGDAREDRNLMPALIEAVASNTTLGRSPRRR